MDRYVDWIALRLASREVCIHGAAVKTPFLRVLVVMICAVSHIEFWI